MKKTKTRRTTIQVVLGRVKAKGLVPKKKMTRMAKVARLKRMTRKQMRKKTNCKSVYGV